VRPLLTVSITSLLTLLFVAACVNTPKEITDLDAFGDTRGLDTIPYYRKDSAAFSTEKALKLQDSEKKQEIKQLIKSDYPNTNIPEPWIPPVNVASEKLTRALRFFPKDNFGFPDWTAAVNKGILRPKSSISDDYDPEDEYLNDFRDWIKDTNLLELDDASRAKYAEMERALAGGPLELDILFQINDRLMANVLFPHKIHSFWLSCKVCHPKIFKPKRGANIFTMYDVWNGEYCGRCHGKVAYQPKGYENCQRCHSSWKKTMGIR